METYKPIEEYWPEWIAEIRELAGTAAAANIELALLWAAAARTGNNMYLSTMDADTCAAIEEMLGITPTAGDSLETRLARIKSYSMSDLPYTEKKLLEVLNMICGDAGSCAITVTPNKYEIVIDIDESCTDKYDEIRKMADKMIPANMIQHFAIVTPDYGMKLYRSSAMALTVSETELAERTIASTPFSLGIYAAAAAAASVGETQLKEWA